MITSSYEYLQEYKFQHINAGDKDTLFETDQTAHPILCL